jgi:hypothetical protein
MNDKELLRLAAKAAEIDFASQSDDDVQINQYVNNKHLLKNGEYWNPLTDDGDALRLAVKLNIDIIFAFDTCTVVSEETAGYIADYGIQSVRRAIVRAAAEIGKTK